MFGDGVRELEGIRRYYKIEYPYRISSADDKREGGKRVPLETISTPSFADACWVSSARIFLEEFPREISFFLLDKIHLFLH